MLRINAEIDDELDGLVELCKMGILDRFGSFAQLVRPDFDLLSRVDDVFSEPSRHDFSLNLPLRVPYCEPCPLPYGRRIRDWRYSNLQAWCGRCLPLVCA